MLCLPWPGVRHAVLHTDRRGDLDHLALVQICRPACAAELGPQRCAIRLHAGVCLCSRGINNRLGIEAARSIVGISSTMHVAPSHPTPPLPRAGSGALVYIYGIIAYNMCSVRWQVIIRCLTASTFILITSNTALPIPHALRPVSRLSTGSSGPTHPQTGG